MFLSDLPTFNRNESKFTVSRFPKHFSRLILSFSESPICKKESKVTISTFWEIHKTVPSWTCHDGSCNGNGKHIPNGSLDPTMNF